jgi:hypothetical protein
LTAWPFDFERRAACALQPITRSEYFRDDDFSWALAIVDEFTELQ